MIKQTVQELTPLVGTCPCAGRLALLQQRSPRPAPARVRTLVVPQPPPRLAHEDEVIRICLAERGNLVAPARRFGRSPDAVRLPAQQLGIQRPPPRRRWTDWTH